MSLLRTKGLQIGQDGTATNNFTLYQPGVPDGTLRIGNGNNGSVTDAITLNSSGNVTVSGSLTANGVQLTNSPIAVATLSSAQSVTDATWTKAQLATEEIDTDSAFDNATNYRFTVPTGKGGKYQISASIGYDGLSNNNNGRILLQIYVNGSGIFPRADVNFTTSYQRYSYLTTSFVKDLSEGDYVELWGYCDAISGNVEFEPYNTYLSIHKLIG